jgi:methyl-accepting chemotaxis protein
MAEKLTRRQYLVDRRIQLQYTWILLIFLFVMFLVSGAILYHTGWLQLIQKLSNVYPQARLVGILNVIYWRMFLGFVIIIPVAFVSAILVSHKIAGPLVRIRRILGKIAQGDFSGTIILRRKDELQDVADLINKMNIQLGARILEQRDLTARAQVLYKDLNERVKKGTLGPDELKKSLGELEEILNEIEKRFETYKFK